MKLLSIQIPRWLIHSEPWRFVGFTSSIVGLLCYALSTSFNFLFGKRNLLKMVIYIVFSFIICLATFFANVWQHSASLRFRAHMAFLVLTVTSVYSFFFDKAVNGKPDVFSLVLCAAFAIMSLSLSRQIHCGFEVDLLYFFLGVLIIQLMKIKLLLGTIGVCFSYFLVILRSSLDFQPENDDLQLEDQEAIAIRVDSQQSNNDSQLAACIEALRNRNSDLIQIILEQVKEENKDQKSLTDAEEEEQIPVVSYDIKIDSLLAETMIDLHKIAQQTAVAGEFGEEFIKVYASCRREFLEESLMNLGLKKLSTDEVHSMSWENQRDMAERWIKACNVCLKILFAGERRLCERVFSGFLAAANLSFMDISGETGTWLLDFADAVATAKPAPGRLFMILDMFEALRDMIPEFESLFPDQLRNEADTVWKRLGEAIWRNFMELGDVIRHQTPEMVSSSNIHHLTRYFMNYLLLACDSRQTLEQVFNEHMHLLKEYPELEPDGRFGSSSSLSMKTVIDWTMEMFECNLEAKSKTFEDLALSHVFLMNNGHYMIQKAENSELGILLGDDWFQKQSEKIKQYHVGYLSSSWDKVFEILKLDGSNDSVQTQPNVAAKEMKKKLKMFNMQFENICRVQSSWYVEEKIREDIMIVLVKTLLPAYGCFIRRFQSVPKLGKNAKKYVKYGVEDIETKLNDLLRGVTASSRRQQ
ncbi:hypothetical protein PIB30_010257 [Stylosanthes scabra]|uniref:Exocyst subunit Exo70 family protein n=1 Tax=Stylosanthes scabra TaxID=79078 RepID=A0ABU6T6F4_9FABA|nr:hypothetical protein [Stylosanthes scabra]